MDVSKGYLTRYGFMVPIDRLKSKLGPRYARFLAKLVSTYYPKTGPPRRAVMYSFVKYNGIQCILLPRTLIRQLKGPIVSDIDVLLAPTKTIHAPLFIELYPNQQLLIDHLCDTVYTANRMTEGSATCILNLRAGMGKTFVAAGLISRLGLRTLFVVLKIPLAVQAVKDLRACLYGDTPDASRPLVGQYRPPGQKTGRKIADQSSIVTNQAVTVIVINSALTLSVDFYDQYSFVVLDEVHAYCSDARRAIFKLASSRAILGMSATTEDRQDGFDVIAHKELAFDGIIRAELVPGFTYEEVLFDCHVNIIRYAGPSKHTHNLTHEATGMVFTHYMHNQFADDPYRTQLAVSELIKLYDWRGKSNVNGESARHFIYVFAEELGILTKMMANVTAALIARQRHDIAQEISAPELNNDLGLKMFTGGLSGEQIVDAVTRGHILFSTYGYAGTGISVTDATAMLFFTPRRANMKQILARILRRGSDITIPRMVIDIVDDKTALRYQVGDRKAAYEFYGFVQHECKVKYTCIDLPAGYIITPDPIETGHII